MPDSLSQTASTPVTQLKGVGPKLADKLARLGIRCIEDLWFHLPYRYQDRTRITPIAALRPGQDAVIEGTIKASDIVFGRRRSLVCRLQDGSGTITLRFFHFNASQKKQLASGQHLRCFGEARPGSSGLEIYHPEYRLVGEMAPMEESLTPIYPSTDGLSQQSWRKLCQQALEFLAAAPPATLIPSAWLPVQCDLLDALNFLHAPPADASLEQVEQGQHPYQLRLAYEELMAHNLALQQLRQHRRSQSAPRLRPNRKWQQRFLSQLGFELTAAQARVTEEIQQDLSQPVPMQRLVQGDVGSGKTVVAALAALNALASGYQVAIMAPTEILAEQHMRNFSAWMQAMDIDTAWLSGKVKGKARSTVLKAIASGEAPLVVGTHALFQEDVQFHRLGLVIIDEQHRFGVHQRLALKDKAGDEGLQAHQLIMTATPIPRTLAMTAYADLDCSMIDELPPGRTPINTVVISEQRRADIIERVRVACREGQQAYWVCTLIEDSETLRAEAAEVTWQRLSESLSELNIGLIHGRLKAQEKSEVMQRFKDGELQLLVATTVIEVGVDVPNASLMIIENAERLGLAQLHQLRGRVGRGQRASHCVLMYRTPLSKHGEERLKALRESNDGFVIAERDLALRGPGEVLGTRQTGLMQFRVADLENHQHLFDDIQQHAPQLLEQYPAAAAALIDRWLPEREQLARV